MRAHEGARRRTKAHTCPAGQVKKAGFGDLRLNGGMRYDVGRREATQERWEKRMILLSKSHKISPKKSIHFTFIFIHIFTFS